MAVRIPDRLTSMPFVAYGKDSNRFPLFNSSVHDILVDSNTLFRLLFDIISRAGIVAQVDDTSESVQAVPNRNVESLSEYPITLT